MTYAPSMKWPSLTSAVGTKVHQVPSIAVGGSNRGSRHGCCRPREGSRRFRATISDSSEPVTTNAAAVGLAVMKLIASDTEDPQVNTYEMWEAENGG